MRNRGGRRRGGGLQGTHIWEHYTAWGAGQTARGCRRCMGQASQWGAMGMRGVQCSECKGLGAVHSEGGGGGEAQYSHAALGGRIAKE